MLSSGALQAETTDWDNLMDAGKQDFKRCEYVAAEKSLLAALEAAKKFGLQDVRLATTFHDLASVYLRQSKLAEAEISYRRSLAINEKTLGPNYPIVASTLHDLGKLLESQGRYDEAEPLYRRVLEIKENVQDNDIDVAYARICLARTYFFQLKYEKAEPLFRHSLELIEKVEPNNPDLEQTQSYLADTYLFESKYVQAEPLLTRLLKIREFEELLSFGVLKLPGTKLRQFAQAQGHR